MARRRRAPSPDADAAAALEEADTIEALAGYRLRAYAPQIATFTAEGWPDFDTDAVCAQHPGHPAVLAYCENVATAERMRAEAR
jgi:hypothetical protein